MRTKILVLLAALTLALSAGASPAVAKKSDEAAAFGRATAAAAASSGLLTASQVVSDPETFTENVSLNF